MYWETRSETNVLHTLESVFLIEPTIEKGLKNSPLSRRPREKQEARKVQTHLWAQAID